MPQIYFTRKSENRKEMFFAEMLRSENNLSPTPLNKIDYCAILAKRCPMVRDKIVRLLLAESLIPKKEGELIDNTADNIIEELLHLGLLQKRNICDDIEVPKRYSKLCLVEVDEVAFFAKAASLPVRAIIEDDGKEIAPDFEDLQIRSLFLITAERRRSSSDSTQGLSRAYIATICKLQNLLVLNLDGKIEYSPDEVGDLVHLRYLCLENSDLDELPKSLGNLQNLQTLDIRMCGNMQELPIEVLNIQQLRHLLMSKSINDGEIRVPKEIGKLVNLITFTGVYAGGGIANELSNLTQLQELGVKRVSEDHASELFAAIMKMENLISLSLEAEEHYDGGTSCSFFPDEFGRFSPPTHLLELHLVGGLVETPSWLTSMSNLTRLSLYFSNLTESPTLVLQFLPKLKYLVLWQVYKATHIGKEFCQAGGFPELETITIDSSFLVDWSEIVNGAFPRLKSLNIRCPELRFLPEGLQNIATLEELHLTPMHGDLARRLKSNENYKLKNILQLSACYLYQNPSSWCIYTGSPQDVLEHA
ncbi:hypothetical protein JCGZ_17797 [Jatropha curcas]|uniref:Disease resistance R13L4/SHOC-2-like LRR domain-containing protein n=1 Tax=Jatropha curcas TaxID=180498 RepID=A0A067K4C5_JATCU|nr:hypothetical protein JCGZ_17797 [Jatropha curcas]